MNCPHVGTLLTLEKKIPIALCLLSTFAIVSNEFVMSKFILRHTQLK